MKATVMTTGPGVIIATATASRNCRSLSHWKSVTTPPWRKGTIARPLPKTKAPASAKYHAMRQSVLASAGPCSPLTRSGQGITRAARARCAGSRRSRYVTPAARKSQTISDSVHAVTAALARKRTHSATSRSSVLRASFQALRAMIAMTAAPMP